MSSNTAAILEHLKLTPGLSSLAPLETPRPYIETRLPRLDALLGGGLPSTITEIVGARSSGRTALAHALAASLTKAGELVACVDLPDAFDPEHAALAGVRLPQVLWVRPQDVRTALRVTEYVVAAGGFRLVLLDLDQPRGGAWAYSRGGRGQADPCGDEGQAQARGGFRARQRAGAPAVWLRLARTATRNGTAVVALGAERSAGAFASLSLEISRQRVAFSHQDGPCPLFDGLDGRVRLSKSKQAPLSETGACLIVPAIA